MYTLRSGDAETVAQTFIAPCAGVLETFAVNLYSFVPQGVEIGYRVYSGSENPLGSLVQTGTLTAEQVFSDPPAQTVLLETPLAVDLGDTFTILFESGSNENAGPLTYGSDLYEGSLVFGGAGALFDGTLGSVQSNFDLLVKTTFGPGDTPPLMTGSLGYGTCPAALPLGRSACRVDASGTFNGEQGQRYTVFLRVAETGRLAFRGEIKPQPGQTVDQSVKFRTKGVDPEAFTLEMVIEEGSVPVPSGSAEVLSTLAFTKGLGGTLRADEALTVFPNPATDAATLRFAVAEQTVATLVVYDALGREVARPVDGVVTGAVEAAFDASGLPAGLYVARLTTEAGTQTVRLSVVR